jgi:hypothetical protein
MTNASHEGDDRRIVFLDIDGVLLSGRAWLLPRNRQLRAETTGMPPGEAAEAVGREATFDAAAVALVVRLCETSGASIVVCSSWRYTVGATLTRSRLVAEGVPERLFHRDWTCEITQSGRPDKRLDIHRWVFGHDMARRGSWLILDDDDVLPGSTLRVDALEGLGVRDAAAAIRFFGCTDVELGAAPIPDEDLEQVVRSFGGARIEACRWLEGAERRAARRDRPSRLFARGDREGARRRLSAAVSQPVERWW